MSVASRPGYSTAVRPALLGAVRAICATPGRWSARDLSLFTARAGSRATGEFMVVGRATNGWGAPWIPNRTSADDQERIVDVAIRDASATEALDWLTAARTGPYNVRRSQFWAVVSRTVEALGVVAPDAELPWHAPVVWTNLYKVAPAAGGNPSAALQRVQQSACLEVLAAEVDHWRPRRLLFLTGEGWARPFLERLGAREVASAFSPVEFVGEMAGGDRVVVAKHPQGRVLREYSGPIGEAFGPRLHR